METIHCMLDSSAKFEVMLLSFDLYEYQFCEGATKEPFNEKKFRAKERISAELYR